MVADGVVFLLGMAEVVHEFGGTPWSKNVTVCAKMKERSRCGREKGVGLDGGPVAIHGGKDMRKSRAVRWQDAAEIEKVGIGRDKRLCLTPLDTPIGNKSDIVFKDKMVGSGRSGSFLLDGRVACSRGRKGGLRGEKTLPTVTTTVQINHMDRGKVWVRRRREERQDTL